MINLSGYKNKKRNISLKTNKFYTMKNKSFFQILLLSFTLIMITSCKKDDPCDAISCVNGGTCVNGTCDCPEGFTGPDCSNQETPSSIRITNIKVTKFPSVAGGGAGWDLFSGADIYVTMSYNNSTIYTHPSFFQDANSGTDYDFPPSTNLNITNPTNQYVISVYDDDGFDTHDFMGGIEFTPYSNNNGFPSTINLDAGGAVAFQLTVDYTF